ncbi:glycosyltransferase family 4 protein [Ekhidna sp.]
MKIVNIGGHYRLRGGSDKYMLSLEKLLSRYGHEVIPFSAKNEFNLPTPHEHYFPTGAFSESKPWKEPFKLFYNNEAKRKLESLIEHENPDIAHLHIYYGNLTVSILQALRKFKIPVVQTLHEYKLICPVYTLRRNNQFCTDCNGRKFYKAAINRCKNGNIVRSAILATHSYFSRLGGDIKYIDHFIAVSDYQRNVILETGIISPDRISTVHNFIDTQVEAASNHQKGDCFVYFGRLDESKGIGTLLAAFENLPHIRLKIIGAGPMESEIKDTLKNKDAKNIDLVGFKEGKELFDEISSAIASIIPSIWPETFGLTILESFSQSKPVIGSRIGGIQEIITDDKNGLLFNPGDEDELRHKVEFLYSERSGKALAMGRQGLKDLQTKFDSNSHYQSILRIYDDLLKQ